MRKKIFLYTLVACSCLFSGCSRQITEQEAMGIALSHAGLTEGLVTFTIVELDTDDANLHYDIEFTTANQQEYHYEIDSSNGKVLEWDVEPIYDGEL